MWAADRREQRRRHQHQHQQQQQREGQRRYPWETCELSSSVCSTGRCGILNQSKTKTSSIHSWSSVNALSLQWFQWFVFLSGIRGAWFSFVF